MNSENLAISDWPRLKGDLDSHPPLYIGLDTSEED